MVIAVIFWAFALMGIIRLCAYARFTLREGNKRGSVMLYIFAFFILLCAVFSIIRL